MLCTFSVILWVEVDSICLHTLSTAIISIWVADLGSRLARMQLLLRQRFPYEGQAAHPRFSPSETLAIPNDMLIQSNNNARNIPIA